MAMLKLEKAQSEKNRFIKNILFNGIQFNLPLSEIYQLGIFIY